MVESCSDTSRDIVFILDHVRPGTLEIDWQDFCLAVDHGLRMHIWVLMDSGTFVAEEFIPYLSIKSLQLQLGLHGDSAPDRPRFGAEGVLKLLETCRLKNAKDPRDKIYAICGIIKATDHNFQDEEFFNILRAWHLVYHILRLKKTV